MIDVSRLTGNEHHVIVAALATYDRELVATLDGTRSDSKRAAAEWQHYLCRELLGELAG